jgi:hypothetical protein
MPNETRAPVKYRVKEKSLIGNQIHEAGAEVEYDGLPADNLQPLCDEGHARAAEYERSNKERVTKMIADNEESSVGDPAQFAAQFQKALAEANAEHQKRMDELQNTLVEAQARAAEQMGAAVAQGIAAVLQQLFPNGLPTAAAPATPAEPETTAGDTKPTEKAAGKAKG